MKNLYLKADSYTYVTNLADPEDKWDRDNTATDWEVHENFVYFGEPDYTDVDLYYGVEFGEPVEEEKLFLVYAIWGTGDSFGYDEDYYCKIVFVGRDKDEAENWLEKAKSSKGFDLKFPWNGYFESLTKIKLIECVVKYD